MRQIFQRRGDTMNTCDTETVLNFHFLKKKTFPLKYKKYNNFQIPICERAGLVNKTQFQFPKNLLPQSEFKDNYV